MQPFGVKEGQFSEKRFKGSNQVEQKTFKTSFYQKNSGLDFTKPTIRILTAALELSKEERDGDSDLYLERSGIIMRANL